MLLVHVCISIRNIISVSTKPSLTCSFYYHSQKPRDGLYKTPVEWQMEGENTVRAEWNTTYSSKKEIDCYDKWRSPNTKTEIWNDLSSMHYLKMFAGIIAVESTVVVTRGGQRDREGRGHWKAWSMVTSQNYIRVRISVYFTWWGNYS